MEYEQKVRKKVWEIFGNSKKVTTFALAIEREIIDAKDGPFVYRLGRKIFILERGVRFPQGLPNKTSNQKKIIARFSLSEGGDEVHPSYIPILHPDIYCSNWLLVIPATLINSILFAYSNL